MEAIKMSAEDKQLEEIFHGEEKPLHPYTVHITLGKPQQPVKSEKKRARQGKENGTEANREANGCRI